MCTRRDQLDVDHRITQRVKADDVKMTDGIAATVTPSTLGLHRDSSKIFKDSSSKPFFLKHPQRIFWNYETNRNLNEWIEWNWNFKHLILTSKWKSMVLGSDNCCILLHLIVITIIKCSPKFYINTYIFQFLLDYFQYFFQLLLIRKDSVDHFRTM